MSNARHVHQPLQMARNCSVTSWHFEIFPWWQQKSDFRCFASWNFGFFSVKSELRPMAETDFTDWSVMFHFWVFLDGSEAPGIQNRRNSHVESDSPNPSGGWTSGIFAWIPAVPKSRQKDWRPQERTDWRVRNYLGSIAGRNKQKSQHKKALFKGLEKGGVEGGVDPHFCQIKFSIQAAPVWVKKGFWVMLSIHPCWFSGCFWSVFGLFLVNKVGWKKGPN